MRNISWILIVLSALSFVLAVVSSTVGPTFLGITSAEGFSYASTNLVLIAIALLLVSEKK